MRIDRALLGLIAATLTLTPRPAAAFDVLGCSYVGGPPNAFVECLNNSSNNRANEVRQQAQAVIDRQRQDLDKLHQQIGVLTNQLNTAQTQLQEARNAAAKTAGEAHDKLVNSLNYARTPAELTALQASRTLPFGRVYQCLEQNGGVARFQADVTALASNPAGAARDIGLRYWRAAQGQFTAPSPDDLLQSATSANPKEEMARVMALGTRIASVDPVAQCAHQALGAAAQATVGAGQQLHAAIDQERRQLFEQRVRPVLERAITKAQGLFLARFRTALEQALRSNGDRTPSGILLAASSVPARSSATDIEPPLLLLAADTPGAKSTDLMKDVISIDVGGIADQALVRGILTPRITNSTAALGNVLALLRRNPGTVTPSERAALLGAVQTSLRADPKIRAAVEIEIMMGIVKSASNNMIGSSAYFYGIPGGGKFVDLGYSGLSYVADMGFRVATEAAGVANTGGTIVSAVESVYKGIDQSVAAELVRATAKALILSGMQAANGRLIDGLTAQMKADTSASLDATIDRFRRQTPGFEAVFDFVQSGVIRQIASGYVTDFEQRLGAYQGAVEALVTAAVAPRP